MIGPYVPEGHTIHRLAVELRGAFGGGPVAVSSPQRRFAAGAALVDGAWLLATDAHGKHLFLGFGRSAGSTGPDDGVRGGPWPGMVERWVHVHLGLIGTFDVVRSDAGAGPVRGVVRLRLARDGVHADLRGPTVCELIEPPGKDAIHARLGPDPLRGDDPTPALDRIGRSRTPVGVLLMDQSVLAGVGNVYRAESLFRAGIDPRRAGRDVPGPVLKEIWDDLVDLMSRGVETGRIDTVRPEHEPAVMGRPPRVDDHGGEVYVYRRSGLPCHVCSGPVSTGVAAARNLFWCPNCQR